MGVVIRQSIFTTIISYSGIVLGYINLMYLYPKFLTLEQIGLLRTVLDFALLLAFFAQAGLSQSIVRFYPQVVKDGKSSQGFVNLVLLLGIAGYTLFLAVFFALDDHIISFFRDESGRIRQYLHLALWLTFIFSSITLLESFARTQLKLAAPRFLNEIMARLLQGIIVTLYFLEVISFDQVIILTVITYLLNLIALVFYMAAIGQLKFELSLTRLPPEKMKQFLTYSVFGLLSSGAFILIGKLDSLMVTALIGFEANAVYTTSFYMAAVIEIPRRALSQANSTLMARAFEQNNIQEVSSLYTKTSINQFIIGALLLIGVWANLRNIYGLMPKGEAFEAGFMVVVIVGFAKLIDMIFGPNSEMLVMSKYYWFNTAALIFMAIAGVTLNYTFIPVYGIEGAAYATAIAIVAYNLVKFIFIYFKFRLQPFTFKTMTVLIIALITLCLNFFLPVIDRPIIDLVYRSAVITLVFSALILITKSSDEIHLLFKQGVSILGRFYSKRD